MFPIASGVMRGAGMQDSRRETRLSGKLAADMILGNSALWLRRWRDGVPDVCRKFQRALRRAWSQPRQVGIAATGKLDQKMLLSI
jgi:hypothetical protein